MRRLVLAAAFALLLGRQWVNAQIPARGLRDQEIEERIRERLAKSAIRTENFKVQVRQGVAIWEGSTSVPQRKGAATRIAKAAGARGVVNNIVVRPAAPKAAPKQSPATGPPHANSPEPPSPRRVKVQWRPRQP